MKIKVIYILALLISFSCGDVVDIPEGVLKKQQMIDVVTEIELSQALIKMKFSVQDTLFDKKQFYTQVYDEFNITEDQLNKSLAYYCERPEILADIYLEVINNLSEKQEEAANVVKPL